MSEHLDKQEYQNVRWCTQLQAINVKIEVCKWVVKDIVIVVAKKTVWFGIKAELLGLIISRCEKEGINCKLKIIKILKDTIMSRLINFTIQFIKYSQWKPSYSFRLICYKSNSLN